MAFQIAMLDYNIKDSKHSNGIISRLAILAIDEQNKGQKPAIIYILILSAIIIVAYAIVIYKAYDSKNVVVKQLTSIEIISKAKARQIVLSIFNQVQEISNKFIMLANKDYKPMLIDQILHIRTLGIRI